MLQNAIRSTLGDGWRRAGNRVLDGFFHFALDAKRKHGPRLGPKRHRCDLESLLGNQLARGKTLPCFSL
jgi:hypothetical protein